MKKNKTVLITGSSKRIGCSIAKSLAKEGYNVAIHFNESENEAKELKSDIQLLGVKSEIFKLNLKRTEDIQPFISRIKNFFGDLSILINNASTFELDSLKTSSIESYDNHMDVNVKAPFFLSKYFVDELKGNEGNIINILDQRVKNITPYFTSYTISKSALFTLTKSLSLSLAPKIKVNAIAPGPTLKSKRQTMKQFNDQIQRTPLKKKVSLSEINNAIKFFLNSQTITGQTIYLDSGQNMGWAHTNLRKFIDD